MKTILQPVKIDAKKQHNIQQLTPSTTNKNQDLNTYKLNELMLNNDLKKNNMTIENSLIKSPSTPEFSPSLLSSPALNLDLSYFESKTDTDIKPTTNTELHLSNGSNLKLTNNKITGIASSAPKQQPSSKVYLDKLLEEIFTNNNQKPNVQTTPNLKRDEDIFSSDKKCDLTSLF